MYKNIGKFGTRAVATKTYHEYRDGQSYLERRNMEIVSQWIKRRVIDAGRHRRHKSDQGSNCDSPSFSGLGENGKRSIWMTLFHGERLQSRRDCFHVPSDLIGAAPSIVWVMNLKVKSCRRHHSWLASRSIHSPLRSIWRRIYHYCESILTEPPNSYDNYLGIGSRNAHIVSNTSRALPTKCRLPVIKAIVLTCS